MRVKALSQARRDDETRSYDNCSFPVSFSCDLRVKYALWFLEVQTAVNVNTSLCCIRIANHRRIGLVPPPKLSARYTISRLRESRRLEP